MKSEKFAIFAENAFAPKTFSWTPVHEKAATIPSDSGGLLNSSSLLTPETKIECIQALHATILRYGTVDKLSFVLVNPVHAFEVIEVHNGFALLDAIDAIGHQVVHGPAISSGLTALKVQLLEVAFLDALGTVELQVGGCRGCRMLFPGSCRHREQGPRRRGL